MNEITGILGNEYFTLKLLRKKHILDTPLSFSFSNKFSLIMAVSPNTDTGIVMLTCFIISPCCEAKFSGLGIQPTPTTLNCHVCEREFPELLNLPMQFSLTYDYNSSSPHGDSNPLEAITMINNKEACSRLSAWFNRTHPLLEGELLAIEAESFLKAFTLEVAVTYEQFIAGGIKIAKVGS